MIGNHEKCFSPWLGFLVILAVCVIIAGAIFFEFKGKRKHHKTHPKGTVVQTVPAKAAVQVAFPDENTGIDTSPGKLLF